MAVQTSAPEQGFVSKSGYLTAAKIDCKGIKGSQFSLEYYGKAEKVSRIKAQALKAFRINLAADNPEAAPVFIGRILKKNGTDKSSFRVRGGDFLKELFNFRKRPKFRMLEKVGCLGYLTPAIRSYLKSTPDDYFNGKEHLYQYIFEVIAPGNRNFQPYMKAKILQELDVDRIEDA